MQDVRLSNGAAVVCGVRTAVSGGQAGGGRAIRTERARAVAEAEAGVGMPGRLPPPRGGQVAGKNALVARGIVRMSISPAGHVHMWDHPGRVTFGRFVEAHGTEHWMSEAGGTHTILIVDDEERLRKALARSFSEDNYRTLSAATGEAAIDLLKNRRVDLVITDLVMPGMDGMTLVRNMRNIAPEIKMVIITAYGSAESMQEAKELGVAHYLAKPFDLADLKSKVSDLLLVAGTRASSRSSCPSGASRRSALCSVCLASGRALGATVGLSRRALVYVRPKRVFLALGRATRAISGLASVFTRR